MATTIVINPGESADITVGGLYVATVKAATTTPPQPARKLLFGYFWVTPEQPAQIADHCNVIECPSGGNWNTPAGVQGIIDMTKNTLTNAKAVGIGKAVLQVDFCGFLPGTSGTKTYRGTVAARALLNQYFSQLSAAGLLSMMVGCYVADEPERESQIPDAALTSFCQDIRVVAGTFGMSPPLSIVYGDQTGSFRGFPGLSSIDWAGIDAYGQGAGVLTSLYPMLRSQMTPQQQLIVVPGGANPWRNDPAPFYDYALMNPVAWIMPFLWTDWGSEPGIARNGLAPAYRAIGQKVIAAG